ncbi:MAG: dihydroorotase family protein [Candidatus Anstonellales archaeon]
MKNKKDEDIILIKKAKVVDSKKIEVKDVLFADKILEVAKDIKKDANIIIDATDLYLFYGLIDPHVHLRNFEESYKEDFESGTKAAVHGGATTVFDMPNNKPFIDSQNLINEKINLAKNSKVFCNLGFYLGLSKNNIENYLDVKNCIGFKLYASQTTNISQTISFDEIKQILESYSFKKSKKPLYVHAEIINNKIIPKNLFEHSEQRSELNELKIVQQLCEVNKEIHITHVSSPYVADYLCKNNVSFDLTPHHCIFYLDENIHLSEKAQNLLKVNPPIRHFESQKFLPGYLENQNCLICSDHAPHSIEEKEKDFEKCPSGISCLDIILPLWFEVFTSIFREEKGLTLLAKKNELLYKKFGIKNKGEIKRKYISDLVLLEKKDNRVDCEKWFSKAKKSPYNGFKLNYNVLTTIINGKIIYHAGKIIH